MNEYFPSDSELPRGWHPPSFDEYHLNLISRRYYRKLTTEERVNFKQNLDKNSSLFKNIISRPYRTLSTEHELNAICDHFNVPKLAYVIEWKERPQSILPIF